MNENQLSYRIIGLAIEVHRQLGPGLLESIYEQALARDLRASGLSVKTQCDIPYVYKDIALDCAFRADIVVNDLVIIEIKAVGALDPVHFSQTLTYLKLAQLKLALLINFNEKVLKHGIHRLVNNL